MRCFVLSIFILTSLNAAADIDGKPIVNPVNCGSSAYSSADKVCQLFSAISGQDACKKVADNCALTSQEIFTGTVLETSKPKNWSGFGSTGALYTSANLCLLRDLKDAPIDSVATAKTVIGDVSIKQRLQFLSFDKAKKEWVGYHRAQACAPAIGCLDMFNQKITARPVQNNLQGAGKKAGDYAITTAYGLEVTSDAIAQGFQVQIPALNVYTPYGVVSASPRFSIGRAMGMVLAPYSNGNVKSSQQGVWGTGKLVDIYGRTAGVKVSETLPTYLITSSQIVDNRAIGYNSNIAFGSRSANPKVPVWTPSAVEFPERPDSNFNIARSANEKTQNAQLAAGVKVEYSPVNLLPETIRSNRFITIQFGVYAEPKVGADFMSQVNLVNTEIAQAATFAMPGVLDYRVDKMDQHKSMSLSTGTSTAALFALTAGVDLVIHLRIPLVFKDINIDLINIHPKTNLLEAVSNGSGVGNRNAYAKTRVKDALATNKSFQEYKTLLNTQPVGTDHIRECFASPSASQPPPAEPTYKPGNPQDLLAGIEYPCNVCIGMDEFNYTDDNGKNQKIDRFLIQIFKSSQNSKPVSTQWSCDAVAKSGCYDMCRYNPNTDQLSVVRTAVEMQAAGQAQGMPPRCK